MDIFSVGGDVACLASQCTIYLLYRLWESFLHMEKPLSLVTTPWIGALVIPKLQNDAILLEVFPLDQQRSSWLSPPDVTSLCQPFFLVSHCLRIKPLFIPYTCPVLMKFFIQKALFGVYRNIDVHCYQYIFINPVSSFMLYNYKLC